MLNEVVNITVIMLALSGLFFFFSATVGLIRFPDFYCRLHATGKGDTLGAILLMLSIVIYLLNKDLSLSTILVCIKIFFIVIFIFLANPTATHALCRAGLISKVEPVTHTEGKGDLAT